MAASASCSHRTNQKRLERITTTNFDGHDGIKFLAEIIFENAQRLGSKFWVGQSFLAYKRRSLIGNDGNHVVIGQTSRVEQLDRCTLFV